MDDADRAVVVIPCFNEARRLKTQEFKRFSALHPNIPFLFVNDGSSDETSRILAEMADGDRFQVLELERNAGKAAAMPCAVAAEWKS